MSKKFQVDPFDLLGQREPFPVAVYLPGRVQLKLEIAWNSFHQNFFSSIPVFFQRTRVPKDAPKVKIFRGCRVEGKIPRKAILAAALWHVAIFVVPWPQLPAAQKRGNPFENTELTWSSPIEDLPLVNIPKAKPKAVAKREVKEAPPAKGADAYHPRQTIFTDPVHPTHPRQTLVNTAAPPEAPKILPTLPNVVQLAATAGPARPRLEISEQTLAKLRPHEVKRKATTDAPGPDMPNLEQRPAAMSLAAVSTPAKPKLEINAGSAPRLGEKTREGEVVPPPEVTAASSSMAGGPSSTLIALSAAPAPPAPAVTVPQGNLAARVSISPEGKQPGVPAGTGTAPTRATDASGAAADLGGGGKSDIGVSISGGNPRPKATVSGLGDGRDLSFSKSVAAVKRPDPNATVEDLPDRTGPPNFAALPPGAKPEQIFSARHVYQMNVNMPNLNSVTGSWIIRFSELHLAGAKRDTGNVSAPVPVLKVDPKYPQTLIEEHVEGEVILYGVIRPDGTVDSIQLVKGIDEQLDANSITAFSQWKFEPATREGQPVPLEAIVHIPFRGPSRQ
jgi:TonB family protein